MAKKEGPKLSIFPTQTMFIMAIAGALLSGGSFWIINYWPKPVSVVPYFGFWEGAIWGLCAGAVVGLVIGYLTDDDHFQDPA